MTAENTNFHCYVIRSRACQSLHCTLLHALRRSWQRRWWEFRPCDTVHPTAPESSKQPFWRGVNICRSRGMGYILVHKRTADTGDQRCTRKDIHVRGRGRTRPWNPCEVPSLLYHRWPHWGLRTQDSGRKSGKSRQVTTLLQLLSPDQWRCIVYLTLCIGNSSPITGMDRPRGFQEVEVPRFRDNGTGWW